MKWDGLGLQMLICWCSSGWEQASQVVQAASGAAGDHESLGTYLQH